MPKPSTAAPARARRTTREAKIRRKAQSMAAKALETLVEIMQGEGQAAVRLAAAREILDRGFGRPKLGEVEEPTEGFTVIVKQFTDPPLRKPADNGGAA